MDTRNIETFNVTTDGDVAAVQLLFRDYAAFLKVDLCFQDFEEEMATFPKFYQLLLLARVDGLAAAAVGLKDFGDGVCEMKRLYTRPNFQGMGLGRRLSGDLIEEARSRGYHIMRLDTLKRLKPALSLYYKFGFVEIEKYYDNPEDGVVYMELDLQAENENTIEG